MVGPAREEEPTPVVLLALTAGTFSSCQHRRSKKSAPSILSNGKVGQVGKFRNGTLILSHADIKKINSSRVPK